jgi:hypothetical protein
MAHRFEMALRRLTNAHHCMTVVIHYGPQQGLQFFDDFGVVHVDIDRGGGTRQESGIHRVWVPLRPRVDIPSRRLRILPGVEHWRLACSRCWDVTSVQETLALLRGAVHKLPRCFALKLKNVCHGQPPAQAQRGFWF